MKAAFLMIGILAIPPAISVRQGEPRLNAVTPDYRLHRLQHLFAARHSPLRNAAAELLAAADRNGLDWRLLPSISIVESGGGKAYRNNNVFGWRSGEKTFPSIRAGIEYVAQRLANSRVYRDKDTAAKLTAYNPVPGYRHRIEAVMHLLEQRTETWIDRVTGPMVW